MGISWQCEWLLASQDWFGSLRLVGVQVWWDKGGIELTEDYASFCGNGNDNHHLGTDFFVHKGIRWPFKRVEFGEISDSHSGEYEDCLLGYCVM
jgi:hypothetical protein